MRAIVYIDGFQFGQRLLAQFVPVCLFLYR